MPLSSSLSYNDIFDFYDSPLGQRVRGAYQKEIYPLWEKSLSRKCLLYGVPFPHNSFQKVKIFTPSHQHKDGVNEQHWPAEDDSFDHIFMAHALEYARFPQDVLDEAWRILKPKGHLTILAPNRLSPWALCDKTPLGWGHPYTMTQLHLHIWSRSFEPLSHHRGLFFMPYPFLNTLGCQSWGRYICSKLGGWVMIEAQKSLIGLTPLQIVHPLSSLKKASLCP